MLKLFQFPKDDPAQAIRARHMLMAGVSYLTIISFVVYCSYVGLFRLKPQVVWIFVGLALGINLLFYMTICSGHNKRLRDPSLTLPQIGISTLWLLFVLYFIEQVRGAILVLFLIIFVFGIFRLRMMEFIISALFALIGYGCVIALLAYRQPQTIDLQIEVMQWTLLAMVLPWFAVIGAYISNIRNALRHKNKEMEKALQTIEHLASHDELTGICSRRHFLDILRREQSRAEREQQLFCLAMLDLDSFKAVNDRYGHLAGDDVLRAFADCVRAEVRQIDCFARYGGEEFSLLLVGADIALARSILERIRTRVEAHAFPHIEKNLTVSIGIAQYSGGETLTDTIGRADRALYAAKDHGRNRIEIADHVPASPTGAANRHV